MRRGKVGIATTLAIFGVVVGGCGKSFEPLSNYFTVEEASSYFSLRYGGQWECDGYGQPDSLDWQFVPRLREKPPLYPFVGCRLMSGGNKEARETGIDPGEILTYGFP